MCGAALGSDQFSFGVFRLFRISNISFKKWGKKETKLVGILRTVKQ